MITLSGTAAADSSASSPASRSTTPEKSASSFADQLAAAIQQTLANAKTGSTIEIDVTAESNQNSDTRHFTINVKSAAAPAAAAAPDPLSAPATQAAPATAPADPNAPLLTPDGYPVALLFYGALHADAVAIPPSAPVSAKVTSTEAYWAQQPRAIQELRRIDDLTERTAQAVDLRQQGYTIDYPIMVEGWSPLAVMQARQSMGYTWVPSFSQPAIQVMPGVNRPGIAPYDAGHPPTGSILVNTDFARGTLDDPALTKSA
jgi:hypothetical protein